MRYSVYHFTVSSSFVNLNNRNGVFLVVFTWPTLCYFSFQAKLVGLYLDTKNYTKALQLGKYTSTD